MQTYLLEWKAPDRVTLIKRIKAADLTDAREQARNMHPSGVLEGASIHVWQEESIHSAGIFHGMKHRTYMGAVKPVSLA